MKRAKRKKRIENNPPCQQEEIHETADPFSLILPELKREIIANLPVKSVAKLGFVSKFWSSIIRGKAFTDSYLALSSTRPCLLCIVYPSWSFHSCSQVDPSSDHRITPCPHYRYGFTPPVRGLICCQDINEVAISNPSTGQFVTLPNVRSRRQGRFIFFGYDPVNDLYKVLFMSVKHNSQKRESGVMSDEHQVFTLGAKQKWRMINCEHPHRPPNGNKGLCINGVVYYYAWINSTQGSLVSFNLSFEKFNVITIPQDLRLEYVCEVVNYSGMIGLTNQPPNGIVNGTLDLWVLEDVIAQEWSKVSVVVPSWINLVGEYVFWFRGALSTGELIFSPEYTPHPFYILSYDPKENNAKKVVIEGLDLGDEFRSIEVFFDHVESPMILPKVKSS